MKKHNIKDRFTILFWCILRKSRIFNFWYKDFLNNLLFEIERCDIPGEKEKLKNKYFNKLKKEIV